MTKRFYSSELNALHYHSINRSTQDGIAAHPEPIDELYKALSVQISQACFGASLPSSPTKESSFFYGLWKNLGDLIPLLLRKQ